MDASKLKPGPELDGAVAAALGGEYDESISSVFWADSCEDWAPSQTWNGAGLVVERLAAKGYIVEVRTWASGNWCEVLRDEDGMHWDCPGDTLPHAISLAALAAMEASCASES